MNLLKLPRFLLITFLVFTGPLSLLFAIADFANGTGLNIVALFVFGFFTILLYVVYTRDILKPSKESEIKLNGISKKFDDFAYKRDFGKDLAVLKDKTSTAAGKWAKQVRVQVDEAKRQAERRKNYIAKVNARSIFSPLEVIVMGGAGWNNGQDKKFLFSMDEANIYLSDIAILEDNERKVDELLEIEISGPGKVTSSAGIVGGGFGVEGAATGIAAATLVNLLTTHSNTKTVIRLTFESVEIIMLTSQLEPDKARVLLSPLFLQTRRKIAIPSHAGVSVELQKLFELKQSGAITSDEYDRLKSRLIS